MPFVAVITVKQPNMHWSMADKLVYPVVFEDRGSAEIGINWSKLFSDAEFALRFTGNWPKHGRRKMSGAVEPVCAVRRWMKHKQKEE